MNDVSSAPGLDPGRLQLGRFVLDLGAGELLSAGGGLVALRKQALEVLLILGSRPGRVVAKDELMQLVWPRVVVGEGSLTQAIADIRRALGDHDHHLVRNVARRGYMLMPQADPVPQEPLVAGRALPGRRRRHVVRGVLLGILLLALGASLAAAWYLRDDRAGSRPMDAAPGAVSLVILPLEVDGDLASEGWLADALLDDLVLEVGRLGTSEVIARQTAQAFRGDSVDPRKVARELGVRYVVKGRLSSVDGRIGLSLVLIDGERGTQRWSERFVVERARLHQALDEFVLRLARHLEVEVIRSAGARVGDLSPAAATAEDLQMRGRSIWYRGFNRHNLLEALALFEKAVALDPDSRAWGGIGIMNNLGAHNGWLPDREAALQRVEEAGRNLDRIDPEGFAAMQVKTMLSYRHDEGGQTLRLSRAWAERYPQPIALGSYGLNLILNGRPLEAIAPLERALRLSPRDVFRAEWQYRLALAHFLLGDFDDALRWGHEAQVSNPELPWPPVHAAAAASLGDRAQARQILAGFLRHHPGYDGSRILQMFKASHPDFADGRERLIAALREIGLP